jgi:hypothetical protein
LGIRQYNCIACVKRSLLSCDLSYCIPNRDLNVRGSLRAL